MDGETFPDFTFQTLATLPLTALINLTLQAVLKMYITSSSGLLYNTVDPLRWSIKLLQQSNRNGKELCRCYV